MGTSPLLVTTDKTNNGVAAGFVSVVYTNEGGN
jgi:hypothetical protein